jgi:hypothetical protein
MENPDLRKAMGMKPDQKGVRVRRVEPTAPESGCLHPSDIILRFDGVDIANDGTSIFLFDMSFIICNVAVFLTTYMILS